MGMFDETDLREWQRELCADGDHMLVPSECLCDPSLGHCAKCGRTTAQIAEEAT